MASFREAGLCPEICGGEKECGRITVHTEMMVEGLFDSPPIVVRLARERAGPSFSHQAGPFWLNEGEAPPRRGRPRRLSHSVQARLRTPELSWGSSPKNFPMKFQGEKSAEGPSPDLAGRPWRADPKVGEWERSRSPLPSPNSPPHYQSRVDERVATQSHQPLKESPKAPLGRTPSGRNPARPIWEGESSRSAGQKQPPWRSCDLGPAPLDAHCSL